jgi:hypothetical protein
MLFPNLNLADIFKAVREFFKGSTKKQQFKKEDDEYKKNAKKLLDYYNGKQIPYLTGVGFEDKLSGQDIIRKMTLNITKKIIDKVSMVYKYPPDRRLVGKDGKDMPDEKQLYNQWVNYVQNFDNYISEAERQKNLFHKVLWRNHFNPVDKRWHFLVEWDYKAHFISGDPLNPIGFSVPVFIADVNLKPEHKTKGEEQIYLFYDDQNYFYWNTKGETWTYYVDYNGQTVDLEGINVYGVSPFTELRKGVPIFDYNTMGSSDLISANESININLNNLNMALHFQAFGIVWDNTGLSKDAAVEITVGPNRQIHLPQATTLNSLDLNPKLMEMIDTIKFQVQAIANTYNLTVNWHQEATPVSGFSLIVQNMDYLEQRQKDVDEAKMQEKKIFKSIVAQQQYHSQRKELEKDEPVIPADADLRVDFQELDLPVNRLEEITVKEYQLRNNIITPIDEILADNPDMSEEEAIEKYEKNKAVNKKYGLADSLRERITNIGGQIA